MTDKSLHTNGFEGAAGSAPYLYERKVTALSLPVDIDQALRFLGYSGQSLTDDLVARLKEMAEVCQRVTKASYVWRAFEIDEEGSQEESITSPKPRILLKGQVLSFEGESITGHLKGAKQAVLLGATLGLANERELRTLTSLNSLDALLFSACSNALIEQVADEAQQDINSWAKENELYAKMRFSPGYGDLPLDIQPEFLKTLNAQKSIGLNISSTNLLIPTKSITAIVGLFDYKPETTYVPCSQCVAYEFCAYREKGLICHA